MQHAKIPASVSPQLDTLRGLSAIAVLVAHANQLIVAPTNQAFFVAFGLVAQAAVMMFFALSGFLICKSITRNGASPGGFSAKAYAADRFNRIVPPLTFSLVLVLVLWTLAPLVFPTGTTQFASHPPFAARAGFDVVPRYLAGTALFVNGFLTGTVSANGPLWSLSFEVWYYVVAGLIAALQGRRGAVAAGILLLVLGVLNWQFLLLGAVWFAGAGVALAHSRGTRLNRFSRPIGAVAAVLAALLAAIDAPVVFYNLAIGLCFAAVLHEIVIGTFSVPTFARRSADYSYTLYIVHFPILLMVYGVMQPRIHGHLAATLAVAALAALGCWALALFLARYLERWRPLQLRAPAAGVVSTAR